MVFGRGFMTGDSVFVPTRHRLYQLGWFKGGKVLSMYPSHGGWFGGQEPGNVLVTAQNVIVAGSTRVDIYTELSLVRKRYEQMMAAAPDDPGPRLEFAEVLFNAGDQEGALGELDEAIRMDGGIDAMRPGTGRELIFSTAMDFAKHAGEGANDHSAMTVGQLFDRANAAADSAAQKASYRLARAQYDLLNKDFSGAVTLCQEILSDEQMRSASEPEGEAAGRAAETAINAAIKADASSYAAVEQRAGAALTAAQGSGESNKLMNVALVFPNSKAAIAARTEAAKRFGAEGKHEAAIEALRQIYSSTVDPAAKGAALESIARNFLAMPGGTGAAVDRLADACRFDGNRKLTQPMRLADGTSLSGISIADAVAALRKALAAEQTAKLADFQLEPSGRDSATAFVATDKPAISNVAALVRPTGEFARMDRVVTWSNGGLSVYAVGQSSPMWTAAGVSELPIGSAWMGNELVVWSGQRIWMLRDDGGVAWGSDLHALGTLALASGSNAIVDAQVANGDDANQIVVANQQVQLQQAQLQMIRQQQMAQQMVIIRGNGRIIIRGGVLQLGG